MFVIDSNQIVHLEICREITDDTTPYVAALIDGRGDVISQPKNSDEMLAHVARPDRKDNHEAPSIIKACRLCVGIS